ncbi:MAG: TOMM precursor leader peptide-binding protein, partial [Micromonosporaceae bacterium]
MVEVIGTGRLAEAIRESSSGAPLVIVASDDWKASARPATRVPWLPVRTEPGRVLIGPLEIPGWPGCVACAEHRRRLTREQPDAFDTARRTGGSSWLTPLGCDVVAALAVAEADRLAGGAPVRTRNALLMVNLADLGVSRHPFLPDPACPVCGGLPADRRDDAWLRLVPRPKPDPERYRLRQLTGEAARLRQRYVDPEVGMIRRLEKRHEGGVVLSQAVLGLTGGTSAAGYGRGRDYPSSQTAAVVEALERWGGWAPGGKRTVVRARYRSLRDDAVDPVTLGLYPPARHEGPGFPYRPFDPERDYRWVWGYSFARQAPILVPESYAYYGSSDAFVQETSNGNALGSCPEEAILYGLLEVAERDAVLRTWYGRRPVPRLALGSVGDRTIRVLVAAIEGETGATVHVWDITQRQGIPCAWAMAVNETPGRPAVVCAAGAHLDPELAVAGALSELGSMATHLTRRYSQPGAAVRARQLAKDASLVLAMSDHSLLHCDPVALERCDFLLTPHEPAAAAMPPGQPRSRHPDLTTDLTTAIDRYLGTGLDVIVVDQTTPEHRAGGFWCVKVIVPGAVPMTFGPRYRR